MGLLDFNFILFKNPSESDILYVQKCLPPMNKRKFIYDYDVTGIDYKKEPTEHSHAEKVIEAKKQQLKYKEDPFFIDQNLNDSLVKAQEKREQKRIDLQSSLQKQLAKDSEYKHGDIISDHLGSIRIESISKDTDTNQLVYIGYEVIKTKLRYIPKKRAIYQTHIIKIK